jgi:nicotinic acid phosphoribosyltransferase
MGASADYPYLDTAYKVVAYNGRPVAKLSTGKATLSGAKQVFRCPGLRDQIGRRDEPPALDSVAILEPVIRAGRRVKCSRGAVSSAISFRNGPSPTACFRPGSDPSTGSSGRAYPGFAEAD